MIAVLSWFEQTWFLLVPMILGFWLAAAILAGMFIGSVLRKMG